MMSTSTSPPIAAASIPKVTNLRNELDYGDPRLRRCAAFYDDARVFRKKFQTSRGVAGIDLHDWKSREGQAALTEMTTSYLDKEGNGLVFWPDDKTSPNYNKYQYSKDRPRITRLVKQLFFRLNQQQFRNNKYKHKDNSAGTASNERGHSEQIPIVLDSIENSPTVSPSLKQSGAPSLYAEPNTPLFPPFAEAPTQTGRVSEADTLLDDDPSHSEDHFGPVQPEIILNTEDVYDSPTSNPPSPRIRSLESINQRLLAKRGIAAVLTTSHSPRSKRQRKQSGVSAEGDNQPAAGDKPPGQTRMQSQTLPRLRRCVQRDGFVGLVELDKYVDLGDDLGSLQGSPSSRPSSTNAAPTVIFRDPDDSTAGTPHLNPSSSYAKPQEESEPSATSGHSPTINLTAGENAAHPDQACFAPAPPNLFYAARSDNHGQESEQPKPVPESRHTSTTPKPASSAGRTQLSGPGEGKPSVSFIYRVVLSRTPAALTERWTPRGRFQDKTLAELCRELPFAEAESQGLTFTIDSPCMKTVERIPPGDEDIFASMKRHINREIRAWFGRQPRASAESPPPRLVLDIIIERMGDENARGADAFEDLELDW